MSVLFLSTLSLRRATSWRLVMNLLSSYFYPRSPCGERPIKQKITVLAIAISIHALLAESDNSPALLSNNQNISIHALLAESDVTTPAGAGSARDFYPRSPCGERLNQGQHTIHPPHFYPRSPCGERLKSSYNG